MLTPTPGRRSQTSGRAPTPAPIRALVPTLVPTLILALLLPLSACSALDWLAAPEDGVRIEASNASEGTAFISSGSFHDRIEPGEFWTWTADRDEVSRVWVVETDREVAEREFPEGYERVTIDVLSGGLVLLR